MQYIVTVGSFLTAATVIITTLKKVYSAVSKLNNTQTALVEGMQACLRSELERRYLKYTTEGSITDAEYHEWEKDYKAYKSLGGNSRGDFWNECIQKLKPEIP